MKQFRIVAFLAFISLVFGQNAPEHWVTTWTAADMAATPVRLAIGQPTTAAQQALTGFNNQTIRMIVPVTAGGRRVKVRFSNAYGTSALTFGAAHVALRTKESGIVAGSDHVLTFGGKPGITIPPGAIAISDGVDANIAAGAELAVSVFVPGATSAPTVHGVGLHTTYISKQGDATGDAMVADAFTTQSWYWLSSVEVLAPAETSAIVALGDSITDGARSTPDSDSSWPSQLAKRLRVNPATARFAILNQGISGNRLLRDGIGPNALARFDEDVLAPAGVRWLVVMEGINDIGRGTGPGANPADAVTVDDLTAAYKQIIERAHGHGIKVMGATLTPYQGAGYYSDKGEAIRSQVNDWIRTGGAFDAVVDFDAVERDPQSPKTFRKEYDSGDHLHPGDAGYKAMADAIDMSVFAAAKHD